MKKEAVPQEPAVTYGGQRKLFYAVDSAGDYSSVHSSGWDVETEATLAAVAELNRQRDQALREARSGTASSLAFHMFNRRMELATLAQTTGLWQWRVRRHLRPHTFAKLSPKLLRRYADALALSVAELQQLPTL